MLQNNDLIIAQPYSEKHVRNQSNLNVTVGHVVTLPLLQHFFPEEMLKFLHGDSLLHEEPEIDCPRIKIYKNPVTDLLAKDKKSALSLRKMTDQILKDGQSGHSLADPLA